LMEPHAKHSSLIQLKNQTNNQFYGTCWKKQIPNGMLLLVQ
jgi:hypothetical protein